MNPELFKGHSRVIAGLSSVAASSPNPAGCGTRTLNADFVTASAARQSMQSEGMDCFTSFAMTVMSFAMTEVRLAVTGRSFAMTKLEHALSMTASR